MSRRVREQTRTFFARTEDGEHDFQIVEITEFHEYHSSGGFQRVKGNMELQTEDGQPVNRVSKGKYHHVTYGLDLVSDDPNAS